MTNSIGIKTANLSINVPIEENGLYNRIWMTLGFRSKGAFLRHIMGRGLAALDTDAAREQEQIRKQYYRSAFCALICLAAFAVTLTDSAQLAARRRCEERTEEVEV